MHRAGTLLENVRPPRPLERATLPVEYPRTELKFKTDSAIQDPALQRKLFLELRQERKRLADERKIPVYLIFHNNTLNEMSVAMPDSKHGMLEISGVTTEKYEAYGSYFIAVIRQFKLTNTSEPTCRSTRTAN